MSAERPMARAPDRSELARFSTLREIQVARGYKPGWVHYAAADAEQKLRRTAA
jgi:hypothetical protein